MLISKSIGKLLFWVVELTIATLIMLYIYTFIW
jgi:hypothetical protein